MPHCLLKGIMAGSAVVLLAQADPATIAAVAIPVLS
jgi:hypothetical protein